MDKIVNGVRIALTAGEIAARQTEEAVVAAGPTPEQIAAYKTRIADAIGDSDERFRALALTILQMRNDDAALLNSAVRGLNLPIYTPVQLRSAVLAKVRNP